MNRVATFFLGAATVALLVVALVLAGVLDGDDGGTRTVTTRVVERSPSTPGDKDSAAVADGGLTIADIYERVSPGVVFVSVTGDTPAVLGGSGSRRTSATGSGFVIDREGHIVTNQHVVDDAKTVRVHFGDGSEGDFVDARVVGVDRDTDLALLKVDPGDAPGELKPLPLGDSSQLRPGDAAIAIGSPFGLEGSITTGIVSALERPIQAPNGFTIQGALQTDAAINPGNSGGPLLDAAGRVIGVNSQIATSTQANSGVGFAVPVNTVKEVVPLLKRDGKIERAYLGVSSGTVTEDLVEEFDLDVDEGALIDSVTDGSPADRAGLRARDVIVAIEGQKVTTSDDVVDKISTRKPGDKVELDVRRGGLRKTVTVTLAKRPARVASPALSP